MTYDNKTIDNQLDGMNMWREREPLQTQHCMVKFRRNDHEEGQLDDGWSM